MAHTLVELETLDEAHGSSALQGCGCSFHRGESHGKTAYSGYCNSDLRDLGGRAAYCGACGSATGASAREHRISCADDCAERTCSYGGTSGSEYEHSAC
jgi:hypothetical protein